MRTGKLSRRDILEGTGSLAATLFASPIKAAAPEPTAITPQLIEAASVSSLTDDSHLAANQSEFGHEAKRHLHLREPGEPGAARDDH